MVLLMRGFLFLFLVIVPIVLVIICFVLIIRHMQKDAEENNEPTLWTPKEKPPVPSENIEKPTKRRMIHLKTVYIPYPISQNIEEIVTSVSDSEYELGYGFDTMYTQKVDNGLVLFMRFQLL